MRWGFVRLGLGDLSRVGYRGKTTNGWQNNYPYSPYSPDGGYSDLPAIRLCSSI